MLEGYVTIVTGAASGLGEAIAARFASEGATVIAADLDQAGAQATIDSLACTRSSDHRAVGFDVSNQHEVLDFFESVEKVDVLVNSAGIREIWDPLELPADDWRRVLDVNLTGTFLCTQAAARIMCTQGSGSIVNISSAAALAGFPKRPAYSASKAAVLGMTRSLSQDLAPSGVRINAICPGLMHTPLTEPYRKDKDFIANLSQTIPMGKMGTADDIAQATVYLASDMSSYVTGTSITVDGGFIAAGTFDVSGTGRAFMAR